MNFHRSFLAAYTCGGSGTSQSVIRCAPRQPTRCAELAASFSVCGRPVSSTAVRGWRWPPRGRDTWKTAATSRSVGPQTSATTDICTSPTTWRTWSSSTRRLCWLPPFCIRSSPVSCTSWSAVRRSHRAETRSFPSRYRRSSRVLATCDGRAVSRYRATRRSGHESGYVGFLYASSLLVDLRSVLTSR